MPCSSWHFASQTCRPGGRHAQRQGRLPRPLGATRLGCRKWPTRCAGSAWPPPPGRGGRGWCPGLCQPRARAKDNSRARSTHGSKAAVVRAWAGISSRSTAARCPCSARAGYWAAVSRRSGRSRRFAGGEEGEHQCPSVSSITCRGEFHAGLRDSHLLLRFVSAPTFFPVVATDASLVVPVGRDHDHRLVGLHEAAARVDDALEQVPPPAHRADGVRSGPMLPPTYPIARHETHPTRWLLNTARPRPTSPSASRAASGRGAPPASRRRGSGQGD